MAKLGCWDTSGNPKPLLPKLLNEHINMVILYLGICRWGIYCTGNIWEIAAGEFTAPTKSWSRSSPMGNLLKFDLLLPKTDFCCIESDFGRFEQNKCTTSAPQVDHECTQVDTSASQVHTSAPQVHRKGTASAPQVHASAPQVHTSAPQVHWSATIRADASKWGAHKNSPKVWVPAPLQTQFVLRYAQSSGKVLNVLIPTPTPFPP